MTAEIVAVGTELLMGQILNTNAQFIAQRLASAGVNCYFQTVVGDNPTRLSETLSLALSRANLVIVTGGLGPTGDDLTKETAAALFNKELQYDEESLSILKKHFAGREMTPNNLKQAMFPVGSIILKNDNGTAPGCIIEESGKAIVLLPGPPREMQPMVEDQLLPYIAQREGSMLYSRIVRIFGVGESAVEHRLKELIDNQQNPTIAPYAVMGEVTLRVTAHCKSVEEGEMLIAPVLDKIEEILGDAVFSTSNEALHEVCGKLMIEKGLTLSLAESCTGGLIASTVVSMPGSSAFFLESAVTYSDLAKQRRLGVKEETLAEFSAVSRETAIEMAEGMKKSSCSDIALSVTGIAGPSGGTLEKPVGLVYIGIADASGAEAFAFRFNGSRERIRQLSMLNALDILRRKIK
ncbi:MAG TPA: competence/damage-inducible protein A [Clostridia bacterium]|nr:competence/damage-inducible protein A [Clostridia bacterium]